MEIGQSGFTLIELSIVLVIIGLLVGGVLAGQQMIRSAELRKLIQQRDSFEIAVNAFSSKYHCRPGDCARAHEFFGATCGDSTADPDTGCDGDGNGFTSLYDNDFAIANDIIQGEHLKFWMHLKLAGLVAGDFSGRGLTTADGPAGLGGTNIPVTTRSLVWSSTYCSGTTANNNGDSILQRNGFCLAGQGTSVVNVPSQPTISRGDAFAIDSKLDDGVPSTGRVRGDLGYECFHDSYFVNGTYETVDCTLGFLTD